MQRFFVILCCLTTCLLNGQTTADFENFSMSSESFLNGEDGSGGFTSGNIWLPNLYEDVWGSWSGWAISSTTDEATPGFMNQYSAMGGGGAESTAQYAVAYVLEANKMALLNEAQGKTVDGLFVTNNAYAYWSMKDGDAFAKKFGGATGNDPDYFKLTIRKILNGVASTDSVDFYLADYRFADNAQDYIVDDWTWVDLHSLGDADSLVFTLSSSDVGQFGMNTPAYFCVDQVVTTDGLSDAEAESEDVLLEVYPNPADDFIVVKGVVGLPVVCRIYDGLGRLVLRRSVTEGGQIGLSHLASGQYVIELLGEGEMTLIPFIKM